MPFLSPALVPITNSLNALSLETKKTLVVWPRTLPMASSYRNRSFSHQSVPCPGYSSATAHNSRPQQNQRKGKKKTNHAGWGWSTHPFFRLFVCLFISAATQSSWVRSRPSPPTGAAQTWRSATLQSGPSRAVCAVAVVVVVVVLSWRRRDRLQTGRRGRRSGLVAPSFSF